MTDREMLELAAKAASYQVVFDEYGDARLDGDHWIPLTDDGDALRLAVKLMEFEPYKSRGYLPCVQENAANTRRAIVRAAAEIGKAMKGEPHAE
jgi:hypothetical protein